MLVQCGLKFEHRSPYTCIVLVTGFLTPPWQYFYHQSVGMPPQTRPSTLAKMISCKELVICMLWKQAV